MKKELLNFILIAIVCLVLGFMLGYRYALKNQIVGVFPPKPPSSDTGVMCTMEAKECPDGSYVGRSGPTCEFAKCPGE
jgi:hypothetical protein